MSEKRVCIIGAGPSGLTAIKACLEDGMKPICYEKTPELGGLWRFRPDNIEGVSSVMRTTVINTSKEINAYSDFPPPEHFPNFMHNDRLLEYLMLYAEKFDLTRHIHFNCSILQVCKAKDYNTTGRWDVQVKNKNGEITSEVFDAVMVCVGHHVFPNMPKFAGLDSFKGKVLHTHEFKSGSGFEDQRVMVIGVGNSGADAAVELSRVAKQVYLSTRRGCWVFQKADANGMPTDVAILTRAITTTFLNYVPWHITNKLLESAASQRFDHCLYGLKPKHRILEQHPTLNDDLPNRILAGTVVVKDDIDHFTDHGVCFVDGKTIYDLDAVVMATGYKIKFPFLTSDIVSTENNEVSLYKYVFPPNETPSTLAIIGLIQPLGSILPISEIQCRWATAVFTGQTKLPSPKDMISEIANTRQIMKKRFVASQRHTIQVEYVQYMDEIADQIGVKPNFLKLLVTDLQLFRACLFDTCFAYQYRLNGPHPWDGAANAILTAKKRILAPLKTRQPHPKTEDSFLTNLLLDPLRFLVVVLLFLLLITIFF